MKNTKFLFIVPVLIIIVFSVFTYLPLLKGQKFQRHDKIQSAYIGKQNKEFKAKTGKEALWFSSTFSGTADPISTKFSGEYLSEFSYFLRGLLTTPIATHLLAAFGVFFGIILVKKNYWLASLSSLAYSFSGFNVVSIIAGHDLKLVAIAYAPYILFGVYHIFKGKSNWGYIMFLAGLSLQLGSRHYQIVYYTALLVTIFGLTELVMLIIEKGNIISFFKKTIITSLLVIVALLPNVGKVWYTMEYTPYSIRGGSELSINNNNAPKGLDIDYAFNGWSYKIAEPLTLFLPNLYGGASTEKLGKNSETYKAFRKNQINPNQFVNNAYTYWGNLRFTAGPNYAGATIVTLFIISLFYLTNKMRVWLITSLVFFLILTWGDHFFLNKILFNTLPVYNKFRNPSMAVTSLNLLMSASIGLGLNNFFTVYTLLERKEKFKKSLYGIAILYGMIFLFWMGSNFTGRVDTLAKLPDWLVNTLVKDRKEMFEKDLVRTILFSGMILASFYFFLKEKLTQKHLLIIVVLISIIDLYSFNDRYLSKKGVFVKDKKESQIRFIPTKADKYILKDTSYYRVLDVTSSAFNDARVSYFHNSIGGYSALKMQRYQDLIEHHISKNNPKVLNMLNAKYFIVNNPKQPVVENPSALGAAWLVTKVDPVNNANEELDALDVIDVASVAVVDTSKFNLNRYDFILDSTDYINMISTNTQKIVYKANLKNKGLAVFSEIYYPKGWEVTIDGKLASYIRVNYVLRAMELSKGEHDIVFEYKPKAYFLGNKISFFGSCTVVVLLLVFIFIVVRDKEFS